MKKAHNPNPNKANQHKPDPRQQKFLAAYLDPKSPTWSNALQSALDAGYAQEYAEVITSKGTTWMAESVRDSDLLKKAYRNMNLALEGELDEDGKSKTIQYKSSEFTLKGLQKGKWSDRVEHTGKDGETLQIIFDNSLKDKK